MAIGEQRVIAVLKYLWEYTDDEHPATTNEIISALEAEGISLERHKVPQICRLLTDMGIEVIEEKSSPNKYYLSSRAFELAEMKLLVDAIQSAKFISLSRSKELISKITALASKSQEKELKRNVYIEGRPKAESRTLLITVDKLNTAINQNRQVEFMYYEYNSQKKRVHKHNGYVYRASPYALVWQNDYYYLLAYSEKHQKITKFRVDRIDQLTVVDLRIVKQPNGFDPVIYLNSLFSMYDGVQKQVRLKCTADMMKVVIDRFGKNVITFSNPDGGFYADVNISVSRTFFGWLFGFAGKIEIVSPQQVRDDYLAMAEQVIEAYQ